MADTPSRRVSLQRLTGFSRVGAPEQDLVVVEEPLEIRVDGDTVATTMRTPGHDRELALGFLFAEGIIASLDDVGSVAHCGRTGDPGRFNVIDVTAAPGTVIDLEKMAAARRGTLTTAACGVCGRRSIDDLLARCLPLPGRASPVTRARIIAARDVLAGTQALFASTGGCHGAALIDAAGAHLATFEDVGRHNAVDKVVGSVRIVGKRQQLASCVLMVSGRVSFEIVQKAVAAGIGVVAGVSAASSLAIDVAARANVTLAGFVRGESLVVYTGAVAP